MLAIFFLIAGLYMVFKKEIRISSKRSIKGKIAQRIGLVFVISGLLPSVIGLIPESPISVILGYVSIASFIIAFLSIFYFIFFYKVQNSGNKISVEKIESPEILKEQSSVNTMSTENLNSKIWYRAIKVVFVLSFIGVEIIGLFFAHSLASEKPFNPSDYGAIPVKMTRAEYQFIYGVAPVLSFESKIRAVDPEEAEKESLLTKAVLLGIKPSDIERESVGKLPISDSDFQILKSNVQKMVDVKIVNRDIDSYVKTSFSKFDNGVHIQILTEYKPNLYKYSLIERIGIYSGIPVIILILFILLSRIFCYIFLGEKLLSLKLHR